MKKVMTSILGLSILASSLFAGDYVLKIGNKNINISSNEIKKIKIGNNVLDVQIVESEFQSYNSKVTHFKYPKFLNPNSQKLNDSIKQILLNTALGSVLLIQEYEMEVPSNIKELMKKEFEKNNAENTFFSKNKNISIKLKDSKVMEGISFDAKNGNKVISKYKILTYKSNNKSLLVVDLDNSNNSSLRDKNYESMSKIFWESLIIKH